MKNNILKLTLAIAVMGGILFFDTSCKKSKLNKETTTDEDNSSAESAFDEIDQSTNDVAVEGGTSKTGQAEHVFITSCASVLVTDADADIDTVFYRASGSSSGIIGDTDITTAPFPRTVLVDFGTSGCTGLDGRVRKGKIKAVFSDRRGNVGTVVTITPENFSVNGYLVEGTRKTTRTQAEVWDIVVTGAKITSPDGDVFTWESTRTRTRIAGSGTSDIFDDEYSVMPGTASGTNREGRNFTATITEAVIKKMNCGNGYTPEPVKGKIEVQPDDLKLRIVDFGDGTCDNQATVTVKKKTYTFTIRK